MEMHSMLMRVLAENRWVCAAVSLGAALIAAGSMFGQVAPASQPAILAKSAACTSQPAAGQPVKRTREQVEALIEQAGKTKPEWYDSVPLEGLDKVDLTWAAEPPPQKRTLGNHIWGIISPNPKRYTEGIKLLHHALTVNKNDPAALAQTMNVLGGCYYDFLEDYPRAAFWWRRANKMEPDKFWWNLVRLARCYYKMGSQQMAVQLLDEYPLDTWSPEAVIRLWAEMGFVEKALDMVEPRARDGIPDAAYLAAGDICRQQCRFPEAIAWYQKVLTTTEGTRGLERNCERAARSIEAITLIEDLDLKRVPDGTYTASAPGFIEETSVQVVVKQGHVASVKVLQSKDDRPQMAWTEIPARIVEKQGLKGIDVVSGATVTSDAIIHAAGKALISATK